MGTLAYNGPFFSLPATFLAGTAAAGGIGFINTIGTFGRFTGPWLVGVLKQQTGNYSSAMAALAILMLASSLIVILMGRRIAVQKLRYSSAVLEREHLEQQRVKDFVAGQDMTTSQHVVAAIQVCDDTAGFAHQQNSRSHVPRLQVALPEMHRTGLRPSRQDRGLPSQNGAFRPSNQ